MKRTFIAVKIPVNEMTQNFINECKRELKNEKIKWVDTSNLHITLFFLGDTDEHLINKINRDFIGISGNFKKNIISLQGAGTFKKGRSPKIIWIGTQIEDELVSLQKEISQVLNNYGYETDQKEYTPHITIGRIKFIDNLSVLDILIERYKNTKFDIIKIDKFIFYESILTSRGPEYKIIKEFYLNES